MLRILAAVALLAPSTALANMAALREEPAVLSGPSALGPAALVVDREELRIDCREEGDEPVCAFRAEYHVRNPSEEPVSVVAAFYGVSVVGTGVLVDGRPAQSLLLESEQRALDEAASSAAGSAGRGYLGPALDRLGFRLELAPLERRELVATGSFVPRPLFRPSYAIPAPDLRHPVLATRGDPSSHSIEYLLAPIRTWGEVRSLRVAVRHPSAWTVSLRAGEGAAWSESGEGGMTVHTYDGGVELGPTLHVGITRPGRPIRNGGPLVGLGAELVSPTLRARVGYEIAGPDYLLYAVAVEGDFVDHLVVAPTLEIATPFILVIPSLGAAIGVPVLVDPGGAEVGVRLQATVSLPYVSVVVPVDMYPGRGTTHPEWIQVGIFGQVSM